MTKKEIQQKARVALTRAYQVSSPADVSLYRVYWVMYSNVLKQLLGEHGDLNGKHVLDVGAGRGILALAIRFLGADVTALEKYVFDHSLTTMFKAGGEEDLLRKWQEYGVTALVEDLARMDEVVATESFDAVVSTEVIEHQKEPKLMMDQIYRVLKPGGIIILTTPNYGRLHARLRLLFGLNPKLDLEPFYLLGQNGFVGHWREYLPSELETMLRLSHLEPKIMFTFCDPFYAVRKKVSVDSLKQMLLHLVSYLVPQAKYQIFAVGRKPTT